MRLTIYYMLLACILLLAVSCTEPNAPVAGSETYFSVEGYFESEVARLENGKYGLEKTIEGTDTSETRQLKSPDWKSELEPFSKAVLGKNPALYYSADTLKEGPVQRIIYRARDEGTALRSLSVYGDPGNPDSLLFIRSVSNMYYRSADTMFYSGTQYRLQIKSEARAGKDTEFHLTGKIINPAVQP